MHRLHTRPYHAPATPAPIRTTTRPSAAKRPPPCPAVAIALASALILAACGGGGGGSGTPDGGGPADGNGDIVGETGEGGIQDLWLLQRLSTVADDGRVVQLLEPLLARNATSFGEPVSLTPALAFRESDALEASVIDAAGAVRAHIDVRVGLLESGTLQGLAILATPDLERGDGNIRASDRVRIDLTSIDDRLSPGQLVVADYYFAIAQPPAGGDSADTALGILAERFAAGTVTYQSVDGSADGEAALLVGNLGTAIEGSVLGLLPPKAQPLQDGLQAGAESCLDLPSLPSFEIPDSVPDISPSDVLPDIGCVDDMLDNIEGGARGAWNNIRPQLSPDDPPPNPDPDPPGFTPSGPVADAPCVANCPDEPPRRCRRDCGSGANDPHLVTFDGLRYSPQAVGEFSAVLDDGGAGGIDAEMQWRLAPWRASRTVSAITAVALRIGEQRLTVDPNRSPVLFVNGEGYALPDGGWPLVSDDGEIVIARRHGHLQVQARGWLYDIALKGTAPDGWLNVWVEPPESAGSVTGLLGRRNADTRDDLTTRDGLVTLPRDHTHAELYEVFMESWRITDASSLFDYPAGESTATFTDRSFPDVPPDAEPGRFDPLAGRDTARAEGLCRLMGIDEQPALGNCVLDFVITGEPGFLTGSQAQLGVDRLARASRFGDEVDGRELLWWRVFENESNYALAGDDRIALVTSRDDENVNWLTAFAPGDGTVLWRWPDVATGCAPAVTADGDVVAQVDAGTAAGGEDGSYDLVLLDGGSGAVLDTWEPEDAVLRLCADGLRVSESGIVLQVARTERRGFVIVDDVLSPLWFGERDQEPLLGGRSVTAYGDVASVADQLFVSFRDRDADGDVAVGLLRIDAETGEGLEYYRSESLRSADDLQLAGDGELVLNGVDADNERMLALIEGAAPGGALRERWSRSFDADAPDALDSPVAAVARGADTLAGWSSTDADGAVMAGLDPETGVARWTAELSSFDNNNEIEPLDDGGFVVAPFGGHWLEAVDAEGSLRWAIPETPRGLNFPRDLAARGDDTLLVLSARANDAPSPGWVLVAVGTAR